MGYIAGPPGLKLSPNLASFVIDDRGNYIVAAVTRQGGIWVYRMGQEETNLLDQLDAEHQDERTALWGAPMLAWRPDGSLILGSITEDESQLVALPVPGVNRSG